jgi:N-acetylglucosaminyldiphosphoundecaprenol N-acetyl-beta-D-mannosaminyltransferase
LTGSDLFPLIWQSAKQHQHKIFIIVSHEELGLQLKQDYDNIRYYTPPFFNPLKEIALFEQLCTEIADEIKDFDPHYVIVGIGFPKQEYLSLAVHARLTKSPLFLLLGASAEFYVGAKKRAPVFLQKMGLEWLHRLLQEPRRLWKRYVLGMSKLLSLYIKYYSRH